MLMWSMREKIYSKYELYKTSSAITCKKWDKCFLKKCERVWSTVSWTEYIEKWIEQDQNISSASGVKMKCITKVILWNTQRLCWSNGITFWKIRMPFISASMYYFAYPPQYTPNHRGWHKNLKFLCLKAEIYDIQILTVTFLLQHPLKDMQWRSTDCGPFRAQP